MKVKLLFSIGVFLMTAGVYTPNLSLGADWSPVPLLPANPLAGSRLFGEKGCVRCHSIHGTGGVLGPDLGQQILNRSLLDIAGAMWNHSPGMEHVFQERKTSRPKFEPEEMANLLAFLYYLGSLDPVGDPEIGARLFGEKRCNVCHSLEGKGGRIGGALDKYSQYASPIYLTAALWNRGKPMAETMRKMAIPRATLRGSDISDLLAYIRSVGHGMERTYIQPGNPQRGEALFKEKRCVECHSLTEHAQGLGPDVRGRRRGSLMQIAGTMWNHGPGMWTKMARLGIAIPVVTEVEMADVISYLYFLQFLDKPGNVERGRRVYREKRCARCHELHGVVGTSGPDLTRIEKLQTPLEIVTEMWNHASTMEQRMLEESVEWPILKGGEMADLIAYLLSIRNGASKPVEAKGPEVKNRK